jgi:hypothetical protein
VFEMMKLIRGPGHEELKRGYWAVQSFLKHGYATRHHSSQISKIYIQEGKVTYCREIMSVEYHVYRTTSI